MSDTGRAGKIRVERRLLTARHGALLLDRKRHIMVNELERLQLHAGRSRQEWEDRAREGAVWLQRAAALDGRERIEACLLYTSPSPRDGLLSRMPSSA